MSPASFIRHLVAAALLIHMSAFAQTAQELIKSGDTWDRRLDAYKALPLYLEAEKRDPDDIQILIRIARQYRHLMTDASLKKEKLRLGYLALKYSERAAALAPKNAEAQLSIAITYGKMLPFLGSKEQVNASPRIKAAVDKTLALDPRNDAAWHILGRWNRVLAEISTVKRALAGAIYGSLPTGSFEDAAKHLEKAVALNPNRLMHYIELGRVYVHLGRKDDARRMINKGLAMPNTEKDDAESKAKGREALEKLR